LPSQLPAPQIADIMRHDRFGASGNGELNQMIVSLVR
jgi:hypothetical protein